MSRSIFFFKKKKKKKKELAKKKERKKERKKKTIHAFPHARLLPFLWTRPGWLMGGGGGGGGGGRGTASSSSSSSSSSRDVAALFDNEDAQKRASREILERHAPSQRCGGAALRVWFRLSGGAFITCMHSSIY